MLKIILGGLGGALALTSVAMGGEPINAKTGMYEITTTTAMSAMSSGTDKQVDKRCMKPSDLDNPMNFMEEDNQGKNCKYNNVEISAKRLTFTLYCPEEKARGKGEYIFAGNTYHGGVVITMPDPENNGPALTVTTKTTAKLVGPCQ